jgi:hypothetical protein
MTRRARGGRGPVGRVVEDLEVELDQATTVLDRVGEEADCGNRESGARISTDEDATLGGRSFSFTSRCLLDGGRYRLGMVLCRPRPRQTRPRDPCSESPPSPPSPPPPLSDPLSLPRHGRRQPTSSIRARSRIFRWENTSPPQRQSRRSRCWTRRSSRPSCLIPTWVRRIRGGEGDGRSLMRRNTESIRNSFGLVQADVVAFLDQYEVRLVGEASLRKLLTLL